MIKFKQVSFGYILHFLFLCLLLSLASIMKKEYWAVMLMIFVWASCGNKVQPGTDEKQGFQMDSVKTGGIQRMQVSDSQTDIKFRGKDYHISIHRTPCDSLNLVDDQAGGSFADNEIALVITRNNGEKFFSKTFTKRSFTSVIDESFLAKSVLEGMVYDKVSDNGIILAASVCYPQTDLYVPISITIAPDGRMSIAKEEVLDENYTGEEAI